MNPQPFNGVNRLQTLDDNLPRSLGQTCMMADEVEYFADLMLVSFSGDAGLIEMRRLCERVFAELRCNGN